MTALYLPIRTLTVAPGYRCEQRQTRGEARTGAQH